MSTAPMSHTRQARVDAVLRRTIADLLRHDRRLCELSVTAHVDGGVVHLLGAVDRPEQLELLRCVVGGFAGVHAVWDRVRVAGRPPIALDLGCGNQRQYPDNVGVDRHPAPSVAVRADLARSLPFGTATVDRIYVVHLLEHLLDFLPLVDECHRVLRPGGVLHVMSPWWRHVNAVADPTHVRLVDVQTIKGVCARADSPLRWYPLHASCDGASVFADLTPAGVTAPSAEHLARFFD